MNAELIRHDKITDEDGYTVEIKIWAVPKTPDKPFGFKYSLVLIIENKRVVGYDNAEGKGDHRHYGDLEEPYAFVSLEKLAKDFFRDVQRIKEEMAWKSKK
jgi:hypothetical protein